VWGTKTEKKRGGGTLLANEGLNFRSNNRTRRPGAACKLHHHYHRHHYSLYFESGWISTRERTQGRMSIWKTNSKLTTKQKLRERERNRKALRDNPKTTGAIGEAVRLWKNPKVNPPPPPPPSVPAQLGIRSGSHQQHERRMESEDIPKRKLEHSFYSEQKLLLYNSPCVNIHELLAAAAHTHTTHSWVMGTSVYVCVGLLYY
jgi:hypothetical protein